MKEILCANNITSSDPTQRPTASDLLLHHPFVCDIDPYRGFDFPTFYREALARAKATSDSDLSGETDSDYDSEEDESDEDDDDDEEVVLDAGKVGVGIRATGAERVLPVLPPKPVFVPVLSPAGMGIGPKQDMNGSTNADHKEGITAGHVEDDEPEVEEVDVYGLVAGYGRPNMGDT